MKRKLAFFGFIAAIVIALSAIYIYADKNIIPPSDPCEFLTNDSWVYHDEKSGEDLVLTFREDFSYSYSCECGEHTGDLDLYEFFSYSKENNAIYIHGSEVGRDEIKVLYADPDYLCLQFDDGAIVYKSKSSKLDESVHEKAEKYVNVNAPVLSLLSFKDGKVTVAPHDYDGDARDSFKDYIYDIELADDAKMLSVSVTVEYGEASLDVVEMSDEDWEYIGEFYTYGYVDIGEDGKIHSITFYGESIVE